MPVTLDLPPHILEAASNKEALEGVSIETLIMRLLETVAEQHSETDHATSRTERSKFGRMPGVVVFIADDFDVIPEGFEEYV